MSAITDPHIKSLCNHVSAITDPRIKMLINHASAIANPRIRILADFVAHANHGFNLDTRGTSIGWRNCQYEKRTSADSTERCLAMYFTHTVQRTLQPGKRLQIHQSYGAVPRISDIDPPIQLIDIRPSSRGTQPINRFSLAADRRDRNPRNIL